MGKPITIFYILSSGHSGSTLLDLMLGSHSAIESGGEVEKYFDYLSVRSARPREKRICTCGKNAVDCPYWQQVGNKVEKLTGCKDVDLSAIDSQQFARNNSAVLGSMLEVSGKRVFCDSSKKYQRLQRLMLSPDFELKIIHLVRDGRAVAYSYKKKNGNYYRPLLRWQRKNLRYNDYFESNNQYLLLNYEDLVREPQRYLTTVLKMANLDFEPQQLAFYTTVQHNLSGNRMRMKKEQIITPDNAYQAELSNLEWLVGSQLAAPALRRFGYAFKPKGS